MENGMNYMWFQQQFSMQGSDGLYSRLSQLPGAQIFRETVDPELDHKTRRVSDKFSENINTIANEPSLAFFRIQEHVRKTLPQLVEQKHEVQNIQQKVQGACFDTEYATNAVKTMYQSEFHFQNIQELLKNAMFMKQQIGYEESRRAGSPGPSPGSSPSVSAASTPPPSSSTLAIASTTPTSSTPLSTPTTSSSNTHPATTSTSPVSGPEVVVVSRSGPEGVVGSRSGPEEAVVSEDSGYASHTLSAMESLNCDSDDIGVAADVDEYSALT